MISWKLFSNELSKLGLLQMNFFFAVTAARFFEAEEELSKNCHKAVEIKKKIEKKKYRQQDQNFWAVVERGDEINAAKCVNEVYVMNAQLR